MARVQNFVNPFFLLSLWNLHYQNRVVEKIFFYFKLISFFQRSACWIFWQRVSPKTRKAQVYILNSCWYFCFFCNVTIPYQNNNKRNNFQIVITLQLSILRPVWCICNFCVYLSWFANWFSNKQLAFGNSSFKLNVYLLFLFLLTLEWNISFFHLLWVMRKNNMYQKFRTLFV